ncbi:MAG TPA: NYN domain-containing protein [Methylomirabilota bacterium]|nr:NYN domain-containing protein [Methylomirabilota bacterium]
MALVRILVDGYSLLHNWPELAPGRPRHSAAARDELIHRLTHYQDASGIPVTVVFDGAAEGPMPPRTKRGGIEVLYSRAGQTADQLIERAAHLFRPYGEVMVVTDDFAERDTVAALGGVASSCHNFIRTVQDTLNDLRRDIQHHNARERSSFRSGKRIPCLLVLVLLAAGWIRPAMAAPADAATPPPTPEGGKFLFIVEMTAASRSCNEASRQTVFDLVLSGVFKQMRAGDSFSIWTFNNQTSFDFGKTDWEPERSFELASKAALFLRERRCEKKADLQQMLTSLGSVVGAVRDLNVFLISLGEPALRGTPFDELINAEYTRRARERKLAKKPFVTTLIARGGQIIGASVTLAGEKITLPARPTLASVRSDTPTNAAPRPVASRVSKAIVIESKPTSPPPPAPSIASPPATNAPSPVPPAAPPVLPVVVPATNSVPTVGDGRLPAPAAPAIAFTNDDVGIDLVRRSAIRTPKVVPSPRELPALKALGPNVDIVDSPAESAPPSPEELLPPAGLAAERAPMSIPGQITVSAREKTPAPPPAAIQAVAPAAPASPSLLWIGLALLALAVGLLAALLWRARPARQGSYITRSFDRS